MADTTEQMQENQQTQPQTPSRGRRQQQNHNPEPEDTEPKDTEPTSEVRRYRCVRPCRYRNKAYRIGDPLAVYGAQEVPPYFKPAS